MLAFVPVFFFASEYAQISLGKSASKPGSSCSTSSSASSSPPRSAAGCSTRAGPNDRWCSACILAAVGFYLWAGKVTSLSFNKQEWYVILAGAGMGFMLGPASTDAVNRASRLSYGEATGITQTVRNYAASLGLAILGTILVNEMRSRVTTSLIAQGEPASRAAHQAAGIAQQAQGSGSGSSSTSGIPHFIRLDFAYATRSVLYVMAGVMAAAAVVALLGLRQGLQEESDESDLDPEVAPAN